MQVQTHGGDIYSKTYRMDFSTNINPLGTPTSVLEAACRGVYQSEHYPDVYCRDLKSAIACRECVDEKQIICGNGAAELIFLLAQAVRPVRALLVSPGFAEYEQALRSVGCDIIFYEMKEQDGFILQEDYLKALQDQVDMVFLCNPANPTGLLIPPELMSRILERCYEKRIFLVVDECFNSFLEERELHSLVKELQNYPNLFILKAFTKIYAMAGLRLGYGLCTDEQLLTRMQSCIQPWNVSIPAQRAGIAAMQEYDFEEETRRYVTGERMYLKNGLEELGLLCMDSKANYLFFKGPVDLYDRCSERGILIRNCSNYRGLGEGYFRIAVRTHEENAELLRELKCILTADGISEMGNGVQP